MKYSESHEWIRVDQLIGTVGITTHAQKELGEVVYLELPTIGKKVRAGEEVAVLESTKAAADIYAPVSGEIIAVNPHLTACPDTINQAPETEGWLFQIRLTNPEELDALLDQEHYLELIH